MTDPITLSAENDTLRQALHRANARIEELESSAVPNAERETGKDQDAAFLARLYLEADKLQGQLSAVVTHLKGRIDGLDVGAAQSQAFELRTATALASIDNTLHVQNALLERISANQTLITLEMHRHARRITELESAYRPTMFDQLSPT